MYTSPPRMRKGHSGNDEALQRVKLHYVDEDGGDSIVDFCANAHRLEEMPSMIVIDDIHAFIPQDRKALSSLLAILESTRGHIEDVRNAPCKVLLVTETTYHDHTHIECAFRRWVQCRWKIGRVGSPAKKALYSANSLSSVHTFSFELHRDSFEVL